MHKPHAGKALTVTHVKLCVAVWSCSCEGLGHGKDYVIVGCACCIFLCCKTLALCNLQPCATQLPPTPCALAAVSAL